MTADAGKDRTFSSCFRISHYFMVLVYLAVLEEAREAFVSHNAERSSAPGSRSRLSHRRSQTRIPPALAPGLAGCVYLHAPLLPGQPFLLRGAQEEALSLDPSVSQPHSWLRGTGAAAASPVPPGVVQRRTWPRAQTLQPGDGRVWSWLWLGAMGVKVTGSLLWRGLKSPAAGPVQVMARAGGDPCTGDVALLLSSGQPHRVS